MTTWTLIHRKGCGKPAFYVEESAIVSLKRPHCYAVLLNGERPAPNDPMVCGSCGHDLGKHDIAFEHLEPRRH